MKTDSKKDIVIAALKEMASESQVSVFAKLNRLSERSKDNRSLKSIAQEYQYAGGAAFSVDRKSTRLNSSHGS